MHKFYHALTNALVRNEITIDQLAEQTGIVVLPRYLHTHSPAVTLHHVHRIARALDVAPLIAHEPDERIIITEGINGISAPRVDPNYARLALRYLRGDISARAFAAEYGIPYATYYGLENGNRPQLATVEDTFGKIGCDVQFLVDYADLASSLKKQLQIPGVGASFSAPAMPVQYSHKEPSRVLTLLAARPRVQQAVIPQKIQESPVPFDISTTESALETFKAFF